MVVAVLLAGYVIYDANVVSISAKLGDELKNLTPHDNEFDFGEWTRINSDIVAWLQIDGTSIDYPVLQAGDNDYYLSRNYREEFATAGSIFLDYRDSINESNFSIVYGHRMGNGEMFTDVTKYSNKSFFDSHRLGKVYMEREVRSLMAVGFAKIRYDANEIYTTHNDVSVALDYLRKNAVVWDEEMNATRGDGGHYMLLSTCDATDKMLRDVLLLIVL